MTTNFEAREVAGFGTAFRQQVWLLGVSNRWLYLILGPIVFLMLILLHMTQLHPMTALVALFAVAASAFWPLMVWYNEGPARREYQWSLPVSRGANEMARVFAGAVWLVVVCGALGVISLTIDYAGGVFEGAPPELISLLYGAESWAYFFTSPLVLYFLVMPLALWSEYRITRWLLGGWIAYVFIALWAQALGFHPLVHVLDLVFSGEGWALGDVLMPDIDDADGWRSAALWLAVGLGLTTVTAMFRPDDLRRKFSSLRRPASWP